MKTARNSERYRLKMLTVVSAAGLFCLESYAVLANKAETWNAGSTNGWGKEAVFAATLSNPGTYLRLAFPAQSILMPVEDGFSGGVDASGGWFSGNYIAAGASNITFSVMGDGHVPHIVRFILHSSVSDREWSYAGVTVSGQAGTWVLNTVPLDYNAGGWSLSEPGASADLFTSDLTSVDRVGLRIQQSGTDAQAYCIDDFCLHGPNLTEFIRGKVIYRGFQTGLVKVIAATTPEGFSGPTVELVTPGNYELSVNTGSNYWIKAFVDSNTNGIPDAWEPLGQYSAIPLYVNTSFAGIDVPLVESLTADGLPTWWVMKYFGSGAGAGAGGGAASAANADPDGDGMSNLQEYLAGTDPNKKESVFSADVENKEDGSGIILKWKSAYPSQTFSVWRCSDLTAGFTRIQGGVVATPPENRFEDSTATGEGPYFYKIKIE